MKQMAYLMNGTRYQRNSNGYTHRIEVGDLNGHSADILPGFPEPEKQDGGPGNETNGISHELHQISTKFWCRQTYGEVHSNIFGLGDLENMGFAAGIFPISLSIAELKLLPVYVVAISISGVGRHAPMLAVEYSVWANHK